jgi:hypothetical protein
VLEVTVPRQTKNAVIHLILEVTDEGAPPLTRYRRVVLNVRG